MGENTGVSAEYLRSRLSYDPESGEFRWRDARADCVGAVAGKREHHGYVQIVIDRRAYMAARLAWLYMTGSWPEAEIDHRNGAKADNRWDNLRPASRSENCANKPKQANNTSGHRGVSRHGARWRAQINIDGRRTLLGVFKTPEDAAACYRKAYEKYFGEFAK